MNKEFNYIEMYMPVTAYVLDLASISLTFDRTSIQSEVRS